MMTALLIVRSFGVGLVVVPLLIVRMAPRAVAEERSLGRELAGYDDHVGGSGSA